MLPSLQEPLVRSAAPEQILSPELSVQPLLQSPTGTIRDTHCQGNCRHKSFEECTSTTQLVFPYRGVYVRHVGDDEAGGEANQGLLFDGSEGDRGSQPGPGGGASV